LKLFRNITILEHLLNHQLRGNQLKANNSALKKLPNSAIFNTYKFNKLYGDLIVRCFQTLNVSYESLNRKGDKGPY